MTRSVFFARRLFSGKDIESGEYPAQILETIAHLEAARINDWGHLERVRTLAGRRAMAQQTGLPQEFVTGLAHRADIARLPYVRRKTILTLSGAGYNTLAKIATADPDQIEFDLDVYFQLTRGKPWKNDKAVIV